MMDVMAAVIYGVNEPFQIETLQLREPLADEVLIKFSATGLCHTDLFVAEGGYPIQFPAVLGHEGAGVVLEVGPGVENLVPGDHVIVSTVPNCGDCVGCRRENTNYCVELYPMVTSTDTPFSKDGTPVHRFLGLGTFADHSVVHENQLAKIRPDASLEYSSLLSCGAATGIGGAMNTAGVTEGSTVIVIGAGGVGLFAVQGAKLAGAKRIIAVDINPQKKQVACDLGATEFVDASAITSSELAKHLTDVTGGGGDFVLECVGSPALQSLALEVTHAGWGVCTMIGVSAGEFRTPGFSLLSGKTITGSSVGGIKARSGLPRLADWYVEGKIKVDELVSHKLSLSEINHGYELMRAGASLRSLIIY